MIQSSQLRDEIARDWSVVRRLCSSTHRIWLHPGGGFVNETPLEEHYNLPFFLAFAVLDQVLDHLIDEGRFDCPGRRPQLGTKMKASQESLSWIDYDTVYEGKEARNMLAHGAELLDRESCFTYIDAVETELKAWRII